MKRTLALALAAVTLLGAVVGCSKPDKAYQQRQPNLPDPNAPRVTLKVGHLNEIDALPLWVAEQQNYYDEQGITVELVAFETAAARDEAIRTGAVDGILADPVAAGRIRGGGAPVKITSVAIGLSADEGKMGIVASADSAITEVGQLKGAEIALTPGSFEQFVAEQLLAEHGVTADQVKWADRPDVAARYEAVFANEVKVALLPDPYLKMVVTRGGTPSHLVVSDADAKQKSPRSVLLFTEQAIKEKADGLKRFYIAYNRAVNDVKTGSDSFLKTAYEKVGLPLTAGIAYTEGFALPFAQPPTKEGLTPVLQWLQQKQLISTPLTYEQLVDSSMLPH